MGTKIWRTDLDGNIVIDTDGTNIVINGIFQGEDLTHKEGWKLENGKWYFYKNGAKHLGWIMWNGVWYYTNSSGVMLTGWLSYRNSWYYFYNSGEMATYTTIDNWYIDENGVATPKHENEDNCDDDSFDI